MPRDDYRVRDRRELCERLEFEVENTASDPHWCGSIEVQCNPQKLGIRFLGETEWHYLDWWEVLLALQAPNPRCQETLRELRSRAFEEGFAAGVQASGRKTASILRMRGEGDAD